MSDQANILVEPLLNSYSKKVTHFNVNGSNGFCATRKTTGAGVGGRFDPGKIAATHFIDETKHICNFKEYKFIHQNTVLKKLYMSSKLV